MERFKLVAAVHLILIEDGKILLQNMVGNKYEQK